jgi:hypothetical protein
MVDIERRKRQLAFLTPVFVLCVKGAACVG